MSIKNVRLKTTETKLLYAEVGAPKVLLSAIFNNKSSDNVTIEIFAYPEYNDVDGVNTLMVADDLTNVYTRVLAPGAVLNWQNSDKILMQEKATFSAKASIAGCVSVLVNYEENED